MYSIIGMLMISSSSNFELFVCTEHLKIYPPSLPTFNFYVIVDIVFNLKSLVWYLNKVPWKDESNEIISNS